jgi:catalase
MDAVFVVLIRNIYPAFVKNKRSCSKLWYKEHYPWLPVGKMVLNKNPDNFFAEVEQAAFGTGVLVDGLDFSDDKLLQGRTFAYSDTQRYRVGPNYLQLPINRPKKYVATHQDGGQMDYRTEFGKYHNPHVNYEPSLMGGLRECNNPGKAHKPYVEGHRKREAISRENNFGQAGETFRRFNDWERDELIRNLIDALSGCRKEIQDRMVALFSKCDEDYGKRVAQGLKQQRKKWS